jgi:hypothetical protein
MIIWTKHSTILPEQSSNPFPEYPGRQIQANDPGTLLHSAFILQGFVKHSSTSKINSIIEEYSLYAAYKCITGDAPNYLRQLL